MAKAQILVVEDEAIVAKNIQMELTSLGYDVPTIAFSGEEALAKAAETQPDLVLMDIVLHGNMDGVQTAEQLRARADVPVVYLSAYADDQTLQRAKATAPLGYLLKPYEERELRTTIETALYKHRMERKLKETERWLSATLRCIQDAVIATDVQGTIRLINPMAETLTGWQRQDALGQDLLTVFHTMDESTSALLLGPAPAAPGDEQAVDWREPCILLNRDGRRIPVEGGRSPILDDDGNFAGLVLAFRDVSERLRAEETIRQIEEQLHEFQKMEAIGQLAGGVAQDFSPLLNTIFENISLVLLGMPKSDPNRDLILSTEKSVLRTARLVKQLLEFAQRTVLRLEPVDLNPCLEQTLAVLRRITDARITLTLHLAKDLWTVRADVTQINEVLMNLCLNARDAIAGEGAIVVESDNVVIHEDHFRQHLQAVPGEFVCLRVRDTGPGITPEIRSRIFEPFFTTKEPDRGAGLGLAVAYGIVEQHHGWIECQSEVGRGTCFEIYLPRYVAPAADLPGQGTAQAR